MALTAASLFAGLGGFDLALAQLGIETVIQAEKDASAQRLLQARFPHAMLYPDATRVDLRGVDIVTAGFSCQGLSSSAATRRAKGVFDPNSTSYVVWGALDCIYAASPEYVVLENSASLKSREYAADLNALLASLAENGYYAHALVLNAGCFGSNMRRRRAFILAAKRPFAIEPPGSVVYECAVRAIGVNNQQGGAAWCAQPSVTLKAKTYTMMVLPDEVRSLTPEAVEVLFGVPVGWTEPAGSESARYERLGNAVTVGTARAALELLFTGRAATHYPPQPYEGLYELTVPARGGTVGSGFGRFMRTMGAGKRKPNFNRLEVDYCLPIFLRWVHQHPETVTPAMWGYIDAVQRRIDIREKAWPATALVEMMQ